MPEDTPDRRIALLVPVGDTHFAAVCKQLRNHVQRFDGLILGVDPSYRSRRQLQSALNFKPIHWLDVDQDEPTELLRLARRSFADDFEYLLWFEPDWGLTLKKPLKRSSLHADAYRVRCTALDGHEAWKNLLISTRLDWQYDFVTQQPVCTRLETKTEFLDSLLVVSTRTPDKEKSGYVRAIEALATLQSRNPENSTFSFYLGHYYACLGDNDTAMNWYQHCLDQNPENPLEQALAIFYSTELSRRSSAVDLSRYYEAFELAPGRAESLFTLVEYFSGEAQWEKAYELAKIAFDIPRPHDAYPINYNIYNYRIPRETAYLAERQGDFKTCTKAASWVLEKNLLPAETDAEFRELRRRCLQTFYPVYPINWDKQNQISVIVCFRNAGKALQRCVESIKIQNYAQFRVFLVDDASDDGCSDHLALDSRFTLIRRSSQVEALQNQHDILLNHCNEEDIAFFLDGDDWLSGNDVFSYINRLFNQSNCWVSYGQCSKDEGDYKLCVPLDFREEEDYGHLGEELKFPIHPRCHRVGLYHRIMDQDPDFQCLKDHNGQFFTLSSDYAHMRAMFQLAGRERIQFVDKLLYNYNYSNPSSTHLKHHQGMLETCAQIAQNPCLQTISNYKSKGSSVVKCDRKTDLLIVSLEGLDAGLARQWIEAGHLPALKRLIEEGGETKLAIEPGFFSTDAFLTSCVTGTTPQTHQNLWADVLENGTYDLVASEETNFRSIGPYWDTLSDAGVRTCTLNYYATPLSRGKNVTQFQNWGVHVSWGNLRSHPAELCEDLVQRFGEKHLNVGTERAEEISEQGHLQLKERLLNRVETKLEAYLHYLKRGEWNVYHVSFDEAHDIGHQLWHVHDPEAPSHTADWVEAHGDPLLAVYQALDESVDKLRKAAGASDIMVIAGSGIQASSSCSKQLDEMLRRIQCAETGESMEKLDSDWLNQSAFTLQSNYQLGAIRIHLAGREPGGWIQPGIEFVRWCELIEKGLMSFIDKHTGCPVVDRVVHTRSSSQSSNLTSMSDSLPDMVVVWARIPQPRAVHSEKYGEIEIKKSPDNPLTYRTGDHNANAALYSSLRLNLEENASMPVEAIAPSICHYFGVNMPLAEVEPVAFLDNA